MKLFKFILLCLFNFSNTSRYDLSINKDPKSEIYNIKTENKLRYLNAKQAFTIGIDNNINCLKSSKQDLDKNTRLLKKS